MAELGGMEGMGGMVQQVVPAAVESQGQYGNIGKDDASG